MESLFSLSSLNPASDASGELSRPAQVALVVADLKEAAALRKTSLALRPVARLALRSKGREKLSEARTKLFSGPASAAGDFFLNDIYPERSPAWRDAQALPAMSSMAGLLPAPALRALRWAARLDALTERLDAAACESWLAGGADLRERQLEALECVAQALIGCARLPMVSQALRAMSFPARMAGLSELQSFLERGLYAFKALPDPEAFVSKLIEHERSLFAKDEKKQDPSA